MSVDVIVAIGNAAAAGVGQVTSSKPGVLEARGGGAD